ncbi:hypothetical protein C816_04298 [Oscillibacter sp. 1-3]|jgi:hypothetical protein|nr:hypothetical protein C816_04298 [Oscillibacter sp. 1-3]MCX4337892.1 hypothetical protein [Bacteroidales bacterium]
MIVNFRGTVEEYQALYKEKNAHLEQFLEQVSPFEFYREIFPEGSFERKGHYEDKKPNGIAVSLPGKGGSVNGIALGIEGDGKARRYIITDDLKMLEELMDTDFTIMAPISYYGKKRSGKFARFLYALVFDIDGVGMPQLRDVLHQMNKDILPKATFVVNSGTGLHLYYVLSEPVPMYPQNQHYLKELKYSLTRQIWNRYTSSIKQPQMQGLMQGFRVVGSGTKLGKGYPVVAFQFGGRVELDDLLEYIPASNGERQKLQGILKKSSMPLAVAKEKYPDWYERRIVKGERRGRWTVKRDLYDWWLRRIQDEIRVGHRYHGIMTLAIYAKKCGIEEEELRQDAYSLLLPYDEMSIEEVNRFTREDVEAALSMFNEDYVTFPRDDIARLSGMSMPVNKRNWRKRKEHIQVMNTMKALKKQLGEAVPVGRPQGSGTAQERVYQWRQQHPEGRKADCHRETGLDPKTIRKWWDCPLPPLRFESGHITVPVEPSKMTSDFLVAAQAEDD